MKVYRAPFDPPAVDYRNYNRDVEEKKEQEHQAAVKKWLVDAGYTGKLTGEIVCFPVADGYAQYMFADGRRSALIHLPYGDAYDYRDVQYLPKAEVIRRMKADKNIASMFAKAK